MSNLSKAIFCLILFHASLLNAQTSRNSINRQTRHILEEKTILKNGLSIDDLIKNQPMEKPGPLAQTQKPNAAELRNCVDQLVSGADVWESELSVAINPHDSSDYLVAAMNLGTGLIGGTLNIPVYHSENDAQNFQVGTFDPDPTWIFSIIMGGGDPVLAYNNNNEVFLTWLLLYVDLFSTPSGHIDMYLSKSSNNGATWSAPETVASGLFETDLNAPAGLIGELVDKQWMCFDNNSSTSNKGNLYIAYTHINSTVQGLNNKILMKTRKPNGQIGTDVQVNSTEYLSVQFSSVDVDKNGFVHVSFLAEVQDEVYALYHAVSKNGGQSFEPENLVSPVHFPGILAEPENPIVGIAPERQYPCPHIKANPLNDEIYAIWTADGLVSQLSDGHNIYFSRSMDGGKNWLPAKTVNEGLNPLTEQFHASLCVNPSGKIGVSCYDRSEDPGSTLTNYVLSVSDNGGFSFQPLLKLNCEATDFAQFPGSDNTFGIGEYNQMICSNTRMMPFWADGRQNNGDLDIYMAKSPINDSLLVGTLNIEKINPEPWASLPYPNPGNGQFSIDVALTSPSALRLEVFDLSGKCRLSQTLSQEYSSGTHQIKFELPSGTWTYRLSSDKQLSAGKLFVN